LQGVRFYTGVPSAEDNPHWHVFWKRKLLTLSWHGAHIHTRPLRYRNKVGEEKGIDVRIAIDVLSCVWRGGCDVALIFSQDQDLSELADEIRTVSSEQGRWLKIASAFPCGPAYTNRKGIERTDWIKIERKHYDECIDRRNYNQ
jgi:uncharacterized LabA/DUF88 family protein